MTNIQKFYSDIEKIKKYERAQNPQSYDGEKVSLEIKNLFIKNNFSIKALAESFADYWFENYIRSSADIKSEPSDISIDKIGAMQSLLELDLEETKALSDNDWKELCSLTNYEAEDLPLDLLNDLMSIFLEKQAF
jgi:hypothetical protein